MKYLLAVPIYRYRQALKPIGFKLSAGTVENGFKKLGLLLAPVYWSLLSELRKDPLWNADETHWKVFENIKNKSSYLWWLWVFASKEVVLYVIDPSRSGSVVSSINGGGFRIFAADRYIDSQINNFPNVKIESNDYKCLDNVKMEINYLNVYSSFIHRLALISFFPNLALIVRFYLPNPVLYFSFPQLS